MAKFLYLAKSKNVWKAIKKIKKIKVKRKNQLPHLKVNIKLITDKRQIGDLIASTISSNSSSEDYCLKFQAIKTKKGEGGGVHLHQLAQKNITHPSQF